jgi:hypothetical protein
VDRINLAKNIYGKIGAITKCIDEFTKVRSNKAAMAYFPDSEDSLNNYLK